MLEEHFVSAAEAARRTGQSERTIRRWIERGKLQATKHGSTFQIALADLTLSFPPSSRLFPRFLPSASRIFPSSPVFSHAASQVFPVLFPGSPRLI